MEGPKKVNISFLLLILLFTLTQTAFALCVTLSYDNLPVDVQGPNIQTDSILVACNLQTAYAQILENKGSNIVLTDQSDKIQAYNAVADINLSMLESEEINAELTVVDDISVDIKLEEPKAVEPTNQAIKSVVKHVNANKLNVRSEPTSQSQLVTSIKRGDKVTYYEKVGEWAKITTWTDKKGYVLDKYLVDSASKVDKVVVQQPVVEKPAETAVASRGDETTDTPPISAEGETLADEIVTYAKTLLGVPYKWGRSSPSGFDCSGFTSYVFGKFGIKVSRSSYDYAKIGTKVSSSNLQKGDILLWDTNRNGTIGHVGIYIGDGAFIHASSSKGKVVTRSVASYSEKYMGARRVIK